MADFYDDWSGPGGAAQKFGDEFDGFLRGGKTDSSERFADQILEALKGKREVRSAFVIGHRVDFVDDNGIDSFENFSALRGGQQDVERFGSGNQNMRGARQHSTAFMCERVTRTDGCTNFRHKDAALPGKLQDFAERDFQVFLNVVAKRF